MAWFDAHAWVHDRLTAAFPALLVTPEQDAKVNRYPAIVWSLAVSNPDHRGIWSANLTVNLLCTADAAVTLIPELGDEIQSWQTPGPVNAATLQNFTQNSSAVSETTKQFVFTYSLIWDL